MENTKIYFNNTVNKNQLKDILSWFIKNYGSLRTQKLLDKLKEIGFQNATQTGISLSIEDLQIPQVKNNILKNTEKEIGRITNSYEKGKLNIVRRTEKLNKIWNTANELIKNEVLVNFRQTNLLNPLYMMTFSGARGNISQIKQLVGMRGLMSDSKGEIIDLPIKNNFREGLNSIEYFISCYGARKGLIDTALKTANSGYLTRRLVYASQNQIVKKPDCYTKNSDLILIDKSKKETYNKTIENLVGRVVAKNIVENENRKLIISSGQDICNVRFESINFVL